MVADKGNAMLISNHPKACHGVQKYIEGLQMAFSGMNEI